MKITCLRCGSLIPPASVNLVERRGFCARCDESFPLTGDRVAIDLPLAGGRPALTRLEFVATPETLGLIIPPGNKPSVRNAFVAAAFAIDLLAAWTTAAALWPGGNAQSVAATSLFLLLGLAATLLALFFARGEFTLSINRRDCTAIWHLYRWSYTRQAPTREITDVVQQEIYTVNDLPRYAILLRHPVRSILFGGTLNDGERRWIAGELRRFLRLDEPAREPVEA